MIEQGRVSINGRVARKGNRVSPGDEVIVDGDRISKADKPIYILLNKPLGITCTTDRKDKTNIIDFIGHEKRIFPVGRLDKDSSGLILLTNQGDIVNRILRVENKHEKEYIVTVNKPVTPEFINKISAGVKILERKTQPCEAERLGKFAFRIVLKQGLNRQIRRMCETLEYRVRSLERVRIMHLNINGIKPGRWRKLTPHELDALSKAIS